LSGDALAGAVRELIDQVAAADASDEALAEAAAAIRATTGRLRAASTHRDPTSLRFAAGDPWRYRRFSPVSGPLNPLAPPVFYDEITAAGIQASVTFGVAYMGPPGYVHGAFVAGAFDDVLGAANMAAGSPGMTVQLNVRYRRPTPLSTPLRVTARHVRREGRRIFAEGAMLAGEEVTAEAEGIFAEITMERARKLFRNGAEGERVDEQAL
jgi:acyl-coenzyme A thioesterase PaaI-like protein